MGRKRKVLAAQNGNANSAPPTKQCDPQIFATYKAIIRAAGRGEVNFKKCVQQMRQLFEKIEHEEAMSMLIDTLKVLMAEDENNEICSTTLKFCAKFLCSYYAEELHPLFKDTLDWVLLTRSHLPNIRFRLCQFVNTLLSAMGSEATVDDNLCDRIIDSMLNHLRDATPSVRLQAIKAMHRLQVPEDPSDPVLRAYQFHLCSDPSPRVRCAVLDCMGRNYATIPYILDRLRDIDEKVRRHTYITMSTYAVRSYKVVQRLMFLENGLNDRSEMVRKAVVNIMLKQWIDMYHGNFVHLVLALKMDANNEELERFRKVSKQMLQEIFNCKKAYSLDKMLEYLPIETEGEFHHCVPHDSLSLELLIYWQCLMEHLVNEGSEDLNAVIPELSVFCAYVERFVKNRNPDMDNFQELEYQYKLLCLLEMAYCYDLGDEVGRENLKNLLGNLLKQTPLNDNAIKVIVQCAENIMTNQTVRMQFFVEKIREMCGLNSSKQNDLVHNRNLVKELLANATSSVNLKISTLKVKILDYEEQELNFVHCKDYVSAQKITDEKNAVIEEYTNLLKPLFKNHPDAASLSLPFTSPAATKNETILKSLQLIFHLVVSQKVHSLDPQVFELYKDFIGRHLGSNNNQILNWALKCSAAFSMFYEAIAKDVYDDLYSQFSKHVDSETWQTAINSIFSLLIRYGIDHFVAVDEDSKLKKNSRQLYTSLELQELDDVPSQSSMVKKSGFIGFISHILDKCDDDAIKCAIVEGYARMILCGKISSPDIIEKLFVIYFNPSTDNRTNQVLGNFFERLISLKKFSVLLPCLMPTIGSVLSATHDSPLNGIRPEVITKFFIDATRQDNANANDCMHNKVASAFLQEIHNNVHNKELCKLLSKEILTLQLNVRRNFQLKLELKASVEKLLSFDFDPRTIKNLNDFKDMLDGVRMQSDESDENADEQETDDDQTQAADKETADDATSIGSEATSILPDAMHLPTLATVAENPSETLSNTTNEAMEVTTTTPAAVIPPESPQRHIPTTYGQENRLRRSFLRKSLNRSHGNLLGLKTVTPAVDASKIRIQARIDSDEKSNANSKAAKENVRAKKSLQYENAQLQDNVDISAAEAAEETMTSANETQLEATNAEEESENSSQLTETSGAANENEHANATISTAAAATVNTPERSTANAANNFNTPEVIAESPTALFPLRSTRRRIATAKMQALRCTPNSQTQTRSKKQQSPNNLSLSITVAAAATSTTAIPVAAATATRSNVTTANKSVETAPQKYNSKLRTRSKRTAKSPIAITAIPLRKRRLNSPSFKDAITAIPALRRQRSSPIVARKGCATKINESIVMVTCEQALAICEEVTRHVTSRFKNFKEATTHFQSNAKSAIPRLQRRNSDDAMTASIAPVTRSGARMAKQNNFVVTRKRYQQNAVGKSNNSRVERSKQAAERPSRIPITKRKK